MKRYKRKFEEADDIKVGDTLIGDFKGSLLDKKKGKVIKVMKDMVNVDFGNGDIYGIALSRIQDGKIGN